MPIRVAGAQIPVTTSISDNLSAVLRAVDFAVGEKTDILLTPEGSLSGYTPSFDRRQMERALRAVLEQAARGPLALALGTCRYEADGRCYNQIRFYGRDGSLLGFHSKTLLCGTLEDPPRGEIEHYAVAPLRTFELCGITCGGLICNDLWANPVCTPMADTHLAQQLAVKGARIVFHAVNGGRDESAYSRVVIRNFHESNLRMRARAGRLYVATVDNCFPTDQRCSSPGGVIGPGGDWLVRIPMTGERYFVHDIAP